MITPGPTELREILCVANTRVTICGETLESPGWNEKHAISVLYGVRAKEVASLDNSFPAKLLTPRARILVKIPQIQFLVSRTSHSHC